MKRISMGLVAIAMAMGFAAFTPAPKAAKTYAYVYKYNDDEIGGENLAANYTVFESEGTCSEESDEMICVIGTDSYAPNGSGHPQLPTTGGYSVRGDVSNIDILFWQPEPEQ